MKVETMEIHEGRRKKMRSLSCVWLFETPWTVAHQAPPSMEFSRPEYWNGLPFPSPGDLPDPGIEPRSPALQMDSLPQSHLGHPQLFLESESEVSPSCLTLCDPMDCSLPGSSIHGIFQARVLDWAAISFSRGSSQPRDWTQVFCIVGRRFTVWATREVQLFLWGP